MNSSLSRRLETVCTKPRVAIGDVMTRAVLCQSPSAKIAYLGNLHDLKNRAKSDHQEIYQMYDQCCAGNNIESVATFPSISQRGDIMSNISPVVLLGVLVASITAVLPSPSVAKGCNGYVSQFEWGCAPWDNNNGPKFPHYRGPAQQARVQPQVTAIRQDAKPDVRSTRSSNGASVINTNGSNIVAQGGGN